MMTQRREPQRESDSRHGDSDTTRLSSELPRTAPRHVSVSAQRCHVPKRTVEQTSVRWGRTSEDEVAVVHRTNHRNHLATLWNSEHTLASIA